jgi:hypothetical protein
MQDKKMRDLGTNRKKKPTVRLLEIREVVTVRNLPALQVSPMGHFSWACRSPTAAGRQLQRATRDGKSQEERLVRMTA